jgi:hypothetical protein
VQVTDSDPDGACASDDVCPGTSISKEVPLKNVKKNHYVAAGSLSLSTGFTFQSSSATKKVYSYTTKDTSGCTCAQIIDKCKYHARYKTDGCPQDMMNAWTGKYSQAGKGKQKCLEKYKASGWW